MLPSCMRADGIRVAEAHPTGPPCHFGSKASALVYHDAIRRHKPRGGTLDTEEERRVLTLRVHRRLPNGRTYNLQVTFSAFALPNVNCSLHLALRHSGRINTGRRYAEAKSGVPTRHSLCCARPDHVRLVLPSRLTTCQCQRISIMPRVTSSSKHKAFRTWA